MGQCLHLYKVQICRMEIKNKYNAFHFKEYTLKFNK